MGIITAIAGFFTGIATSLGFGAAAATAIGATVGRFVLSTVFSLGLSLLTPKPSIAKQEVQATINQAAGPRTRLYGRGVLGGVRAFWETKADKLHEVIILNHGPLSAKLSYWLDGSPVSVNAAGDVVSTPYEQNVNLDWRDGSADGGNYPEIKTEYPTLWTESHKLSGQATLRAVFTAPSAAKYSKMFPRGPHTNVQIEAEGAAVLDVRDGSTSYSDNAALVTYDFVAHSDGYRIPTAKIDIQMFSDFADHCDELIDLKDGGTEPRYRLWGVVSLLDTPKSVLQRMSLACGATVFQTAEGKVGITPWKYSEPDVTISDDDIFSFEKTKGSNSLNRFNVLTGQYTSADHGYREVDAQAWQDEEALLISFEKPKEMFVDMCPSHSQMRRLMKMQMVQKNRKWTGRIVTNLVGIKARFPKGDGIHTIRVVYPGLGIDEVVQVLGHTYVAEKVKGGAVLRKCVIDIAHVSEDWFSWDPQTEEGDAPTIAEAPLGISTTPVPVITSLEEITTTNTVRVTTIGTLRDDLVLEIWYKLSSEAVWEALAVAGVHASTPVLVDGSEYQFKTKYQGGEWSAISTITIAV